ncbi:sulfurtransferase complex subunit TusB [Photobacterium ganghwense]|uniref:sulfurtransferase complex subunit TusB n=1 Tax=Photobacterium ganghwense TaxID=320778 RepID=UPI0039F147A2
MLHIFTSSPFQSRALEQSLSTIVADDAVLLTQDAVLAITANFDALTVLRDQGITISVLLPDLHARGLVGRLGVGFEGVDYQGFVSLTEAHETQMKWD